MNKIEAGIGTYFGTKPNHTQFSNKGYCPLESLFPPERPKVIKIYDGPTTCLVIKLKSYLGTFSPMVPTVFI